MICYYEMKYNKCVFEVWVNQMMCLKYNYFSLQMKIWKENLSAMRRTFYYV